MDSVFSKNSEFIVFDRDILNKLINDKLILKIGRKHKIWKCSRCDFSNPNEASVGWHYTNVHNNTKNT